MWRVSSFARTGLFRCTQPWAAISRRVSVEMSPVRTMAGMSCWSCFLRLAITSSPLSPFGRL